MWWKDNKSKLIKKIFKNNKRPILEGTLVIKGPNLLNEIIYIIEGKNEKNVITKI
jgi:hypothetical protein